MSSTVFSISLNELDMAKLGELQNKYPELSRNAMIRHIIHVMHSGTHDDLEKIRESLNYFYTENKKLRGDTD